MLNWLNDTLMSSRKCFSREATFRWFVVLVIGFMTWQEHVGVTSFIRELWIEPSRYESMLHFFRSKAWQLGTLREWWIQIVFSSGTIYYEFGMPILVGDGTKQNKYGMKMPCVKRMMQQSGNASKHYIFGHMFGAIGVLAGDMGKLFCIPLSAKIHDGDAQIRKWTDENVKEESHVPRIIREACNVAEVMKQKSILLLDRYYLTKPALIALREEEKKSREPAAQYSDKGKTERKSFYKTCP